MPFRVGVYLDPKQDDGKYSDEYVAINVAQEVSFNDDMTAICVWDDRDEPIHLFYGGEQWRRA